MILSRDPQFFNQKGYGGTFCELVLHELYLDKVSYFQRLTDVSIVQLITLNL